MFLSFLLRSRRFEASDGWRPRLDVFPFPQLPASLTQLLDAPQCLFAARPSAIVATIFCSLGYPTREWDSRTNP